MLKNGKENISDLDIPLDILKLLLLSRKFKLQCLDKKFLPIKDIISSFEIAINNLDINTKMNLRTKFISKLPNNCNKLQLQNKHNPIQILLINTVKRSKLFFNKHSNDIIITRADIKINKISISLTPMVACHQLERNLSTGKLIDKEKFFVKDAFKFFFQ